MIRHCDGEDPNLVRFNDSLDENGKLVTNRVSCDCGLVFDDVYQLTIYPHIRF